MPVMIGSMVATYGILSTKAEKSTEPQTIIVYNKKRFFPPTFAIPFATKSMTPTSVMPSITRNRPSKIQRVSKSIERTDFLIFSGIFFICKSASIQITAMTQQMIPLMVLGVFGIKDAIIRHTTTAQRAIVGKIPSTSVFSSAVTF